MTNFSGLTVDTLGSEMIRYFSNCSKGRFHLLVTLVFCAFLHQNYYCQKTNPKKFVLHPSQDSTAIYSSNKSRPFKYGFAYDTAAFRHQTETIKKMLDFIDIKKNDYVADVGGASGWYEAMFSVFTEGVNYFVEDIDTAYSNKIELDKAVKFYTKYRKSKQSNSFRFMLGTKRKTYLPDSLFDKILINNAFHEFAYQKNMLNDIKKKLKKNGQLVIFETYSNEFIEYNHKDCGLKAVNAENLIQQLKKQGLYLTKISDPYWSLFNFMAFSTNKEKEVDFSAQFAFGIGLKELFFSNIMEDPKAAKQIEGILKDNKAIESRFIHFAENLSIVGEYFIRMETNAAALNTYKMELDLFPGQAGDIEKEIDKVGKLFMEGSYFTRAQAIFKINLTLFPKSYKAYMSYGDACEGLRKKDEAIRNYQKALDLSPKNPVIIETIKKLKASKNKAVMPTKDYQEKD